MVCRDAIALLLLDVTTEAAILSYILAELTILFRINFFHITCLHPFLIRRLSLSLSLAITKIRQYTDPSPCCSYLCSPSLGRLVLNEIAVSEALICSGHIQCL